MFKQIFQTIFPLHMLIALATCIYINMCIFKSEHIVQSVIGSFIIYLVLTFIMLFVYFKCSKS